jgi:uncharacterized protein DUF4386
MSKTRIAGIFYVLTFVFGIYALIIRGPFANQAGLIGGGCYLVVTIVLYQLFKPVHAGLSLLAAAVSLVGIGYGALGFTAVNSIVIFGVYCLLIGYLSLRSSFVPRVVGVLMVCAGLGWLTYLSPQLAKALHPYLLGPGMIGEAALTIWLLVADVHVPAPSAAQVHA